MKTILLTAALILGVFSVVSPAQSTDAQSNPAQEFVGLWQSKRRFGPDVRGTLLVKQASDKWQAEIAGRAAPAKWNGDSISFELANGQGKFRGHLDARRTKVVGHWIQAETVESGLAYASPVTLVRDKHNVWHGEVSPLDDTVTFYLMVNARADGSVGAFLKNPERNLGWTAYRVDYIEREGELVKLFTANKGNEKGRLLAEGKYDANSKTLSVHFQRGGGTFDFRRVGENGMSDFYPRGRPTGNYIYAPPPALGDGWQTGTPEEVGISRSGIQKFIQAMIDTPMDSVNAPEIHGILIARHGKLVLEEYFHGENRDKPHDTRSASKSVAADLIGAAIQSGIPLKTSDSVYQLMNGGTFPTDLDPRKKALTLEHLLTMSSGLDCDDWDEKSPGYEDRMWEQTEHPDFYKWTMALKMLREPGEKFAYCSAGPNLAGGVLTRVARKWGPIMFQNLLAEPLNIRNYYLTLSPTEDYTMTGGARFLPRDFMKLGQVHVGGGVWNGRRIFTSEWSRRATSPLIASPQPATPDLKYGYLWWVSEYQYKGRTIRAFNAGGNGGQIVMGIPELDLVIATYAGNYADRMLFTIVQKYIPQHILPAIER